MEKVFYINILFGNERKRVFQELSKVIVDPDFHFQIHPFRMSPILVSKNTMQNNDTHYTDMKINIQNHLTIMNDINRSGMRFKTPFEKTVFVNYTTEELTPAISFGRIKYYLCDYINEENINIVTSTEAIFIDFMKKLPKTVALNSVFLNYTILTLNDGDIDRRLQDPSTLDIGEQTDDDLTFILRNNLKINDDNNTAAVSKSRSLILPYYPFRKSIFSATQNIKDAINAIKTSNRHYIYYPFTQSEWLIILRNIMYEKAFLNFLINNDLYPSHIKVHKTYRGVAGVNYVMFWNLQKKRKLHILNNAVFNYSNAFKTISIIHSHWLNYNTKFTYSGLPTLKLDYYCLHPDCGLFV